MRRRKTNESGAALVEFALLLPVFMALVLGMFSGGIIYNQKMDTTHATREGARYGSAVSKDQTWTSGTWASNVRDLVVERSAGDLAAGSGTTAGISSDGVCVALVTGSPAAVVANPTGVSGNYYSTGGTTCFTDNSSDSGIRVQVRGRRQGKLEVLFFSQNVNLTANATAHYEGS